MVVRTTLLIGGCSSTDYDDESAPASPAAEDVPETPESAPSEAPLASAPTPPWPDSDVGAVFTISNAADANEVLAFERDANGTLTRAGTYPTGGRGRGAGLGSQGALALSADGKVLIVVDAGSNQISSFSVDGAELAFRSRVSSGGTLPISVAVREGLVYALNGGEHSNISGFRLDASGSLSALPNSTRSLSVANAGPAQIAFAPRGDTLVVTEKATSKIDTFVLQQDGTPSDGEAAVQQES